MKNEEILKLIAEKDEMTKLKKLKKLKKSIKIQQKYCNLLDKNHPRFH